MHKHDDPTLIEYSVTLTIAVNAHDAHEAIAYFLEDANDPEFVLQYTVAQMDGPMEMVEYHHPASLN